MNNTALTRCAVLASSAIVLGSSPLLTAGTPSPYVPIPTPEPECGNPGWTVTAAALYLKNYQSSQALSESWGGGYDGDFDWGFRGSIGYERLDGLFFRVVGFWYEGDFDYSDINPDDFEVDSANAGGKFKAWDIDLLIGDTFCPTENTSLEVSAGLRYAQLEESTRGDYIFGPPRDETVLSYDQEIEFDGWGPTFQIRGRRTLTDRIALYADFQQSFLFGERTLRFEGAPEGDSDTLASISEIRGGIEFGWGWNQIQNAYLRLGGEGQFWLVDSADIGLVGGVAEVGFNF